ncbi:hypothetical protein DV515_00003629 [Chloebia gouldiae]|uniref:Uncharacterized protein n=1 Tax=Chloebia gouldiae TaxID=44316 RepID=A0A3L8STR5_CHLGU|nr:hypothetical protein DV515_00003629 [Chloebia gouldiae]
MDARAVAAGEVAHHSCHSFSAHANQASPEGRAGRDSYHSRQDSAPRFIVVFAAQWNALRNSSKLLMAPITLQREKIPDIYIPSSESLVKSGENFGQLYLPWLTMIVFTPGAHPPTLPLPDPLSPLNLTCAEPAVTVTVTSQPAVRLQLAPKAGVEHNFHLVLFPGAILRLDPPSSQQIPLAVTESIQSFSFSNMSIKAQRIPSVNSSICKIFSKSIPSKMYHGRIPRWEILSSAATYKRMKTELLYWPRRVAKAWTKLNFLSDHSPPAPMLDSSTGQRKGLAGDMQSTEEVVALPSKSSILLQTVEAAHSPALPAMERAPPAMPPLQEGKRVQSEGELAVFPIVNNQVTRIILLEYIKSDLTPHLGTAPTMFKADQNTEWDPPKGQSFRTNLLPEGL